jgi:hypothetical protein
MSVSFSHSFSNNKRREKNHHCALGEKRLCAFVKKGEKSGEGKKLKGKRFFASFVWSGKFLLVFVDCSGLFVAILVFFYRKESDHCLDYRISVEFGVFV